MKSSENFRITRKRKDSLTYKIGGLKIGNRPCNKCVCEHSILTCEKYSGTIPDRILQNESKCRYRTLE